MCAFAPAGLGCAPWLLWAPRAVRRVNASVRRDTPLAARAMPCRVFLHSVPRVFSDSAPGREARVCCCALHVGLAAMRRGAVCCCYFTAARLSCAPASSSSDTYFAAVAGTSWTPTRQLVSERDGHALLEMLARDVMFYCRGYPTF